MTIGTKSVLYGAHCFCIHPWFVALAWWKLYGSQRVYVGYRGSGPPDTWRWRLGFRGGPVFARIWTSLPLWVAFFVHDIGYWGKPNMDGPEGEEHPAVGGALMGRWFGEPWQQFTENHSRFYVAKRPWQNPSPLCFADKMAIVVTPAWLYLPMVNWTGEIHEYMAHAVRGAEGKYAYENIATHGQRAWHASVKTYLTRWIQENRHGADTTRV